MNIKGDALDNRKSLVSIYHHIFYFQNLFAAGNLFFFNIEDNISADHHSGEGCFVDIDGFRISYDLPLLKNSHPVAEFHDLIKFVADQNNTMPLFLHLIQYFKEIFNLLQGKDRGRLVQN